MYARAMSGDAVTALSPVSAWCWRHPGPMTGPGTNQHVLGERRASDVATLDDENGRRLRAAGSRSASSC
jgi:hypothetical protein